MLEWILQIYPVQSSIVDMCCDATHVVSRGCSRWYLACCTCISTWTSVLSSLWRKNGADYYGEPQNFGDFFFRPLNEHIVWNPAEKKWYTFLCTNGRFRHLELQGTTLQDPCCEFTPMSRSWIPPALIQSFQLRFLTGRQLTPPFRWHSPKK